MITPTETSAEVAAEFQPCRFLRTKKMYIPALADTALVDPHDQSFYWCNKTQSALGCDDYPVHPCSCQPGRGCHET